MDISSREEKPNTALVHIVVNDLDFVGIVSEEEFVGCLTIRTNDCAEVLKHCSIVIFDDLVLFNKYEQKENQRVVLHIKGSDGVWGCIRQTRRYTVVIPSILTAVAMAVDGRMFSICDEHLTQLMDRIHDSRKWGLVSDNVADMKTKEYRENIIVFETPFYDHAVFDSCAAIIFTSEDHVPTGINKPLIHWKKITRKGCRVTKIGEGRYEAEAECLGGVLSIITREEHMMAVENHYRSKNENNCS